METRIEGQMEIKKAWLPGVGSLKTVGHRRRCGIDTELLDKALVLEIPIASVSLEGNEK